MCDFGSVVFLSLVWRVGKRERKDKNVFKIVRTEALTDAIYLMDVEAPRVAKNCLPGQFVIVRGSEDGERIPLTICDYSREAGTITRFARSLATIPIVPIPQYASITVSFFFRSAYLIALLYNFSV